jgi:hypothetical protein
MGNVWLAVLFIDYASESQLLFAKEYDIIYDKLCQ